MSEPGCQAVLPKAENVFTFAAKHATDEPAAEAGDTEDPLDGHAFPSHALDQRVGRLAPLKPLILQPLCSGQDARVEFGMIGHLADLRHRAADCGQERIACILEEVPAVGDLYGVRKSL
ncbi:hypothetical protein PFC51_20135 [Paracoccus pantotrophus]|nr:hypothetical protein [Paracoccus pantotrophus]